MRLAVAVVLIALGAVDTPPPTQTVRIDVIAADGRGRNVDTLKPADFDVRDDGVPQRVDDVRFVRDDPAVAARLVAVYLDEYHVSPGATDRVRQAIERFVTERLTPRDLLVVMKPLDSLLAITASTDRDPALASIRSFEGRRGLYEPRNSYERNFMAGVPARVESMRTQVAMSALSALALHFANVPDQRKTMIVVSEGMGRVERRRQEYLPTPETIVRSAQQSNVAVYVVNPGDALAPGVDTLAQLAAETAGQTIANDLDAGLRRAMDDASGYYLITYRASRPD